MFIGIKIVPRLLAGEVRQLAQRSAAAAREIKALIGESGQKVANGSTLADQAGATMQKVVASVGSVSAPIAEIAHASQDQSAGIAQLAVGLADMERVVQQNAAIVEEAATATATLKQRARGLLQMVARFKVARTGVQEQAAAPQGMPWLLSRPAPL